MSQNINEPVPGIGGVATATGAVAKSGVIFASQVRSFTGASGGTASGVYVSQEFYNPSAKGVRFNLVIAPTGPATGTVTLKLQVIDPVSNTVWTDVSGATTAAIAGTGALTGTLMTIYPGLSGIANAADIVNGFVGPRWRAVATVALDALTFTVGADYLL